MIAKILYSLFALPIAIMFWYAMKASANDRSDRVFPPAARIAVKLGAVLAVSLLLMFALGGTWGPWLAVLVVAAVTVPFLYPIALIAIVIVHSWVTGKPVRWN